MVHYDDYIIDTEPDIAEPKPYDPIPVDEPKHVKKTISIKNALHHTIAVGQLNSDWESVNFIIGKSERKTKGIKWLATLYPNDIIHLTFLDQQEITP